MELNQDQSQTQKQNRSSEPDESVGTIPAFFFDKKKLDRLAEEQGERFRDAAPFPHIYLDDFLEPWVIDRLLNEFKEPEDNVRVYETRNASRHEKMSTEVEYELGPFTRHFFYCLNSSVFIRFLEKLSGIENLVPDPHLFGGGLHRTKRGGFLKMHVDNNWDTKLLLYRRMNLILYLNKDWKDEYGGHLEFWDKDLTERKAKIAPVANRLALFYNSEISFHGHPDPLDCPENISRKSIATYYYTSERPASEVTRLPHTTKYRPRPGEAFKKRRIGLRVFERFIPPVVSDVFKYLNRRKQVQKLK